MDIKSFSTLFFVASSIEDDALRGHAYETLIDTGRLLMPQSTTVEMAGYVTHRLFVQKVDYELKWAAILIIKMLLFSELEKDEMVAAGLPVRQLKELTALLLMHVLVKTEDKEQELYALAIKNFVKTDEILRSTIESESFIKAGGLINEITSTIGRGTINNSFRLN